MNEAASEIRTDRVGTRTAAGLAFGCFGILFSVWIPTLALVFGIVAIVAGSLDLRGSTGRRRRFARLTIGLGIVVILVTVLLVIVTSGGPSSGNASSFA